MTPSEMKELMLANQLKDEGKIKDAYQIVLDLEIKSNLTLKEKLSCKLLKAKLEEILGNFKEAINIAKDLFQDFQEQGDMISALDALIIQASAYMLTVNITKGEEKIKNAEDLLKTIKEKNPLDSREGESNLLKVKAGLIFFKGDIQYSLDLNNQAYEIAKEIGNKGIIAALLNNIADKYHHLKEYDKAIKYAKKSIEYNIEPSLVYALGTLIEIYISKGDIQEAKVSLDILREHAEKLDTKRYKTLYYSSKAKILKSSLRARDRIKAEDIFKELALNDSLLSEPRIDAILSLCDLYLTELRITNDVEIINEIQPYIKTLLNIAEHKHLYLYLAETYLLQAKLSLLTSDIKNAKIFLIQAQKIAEAYGLEQLAMKISHEHDELLKQIKMWENLEGSDISLSERLKLAGLSEQLEIMVKRQSYDVPELSDEEPIYLLIVSEGGVPFFTQSFMEDKAFEDHLFGGFFTAINSFINEMFSEGLDRVSFGKYTLLVNAVSPFLMCYVYKGQSYSAQKRIKLFIDEMKSHKEVWNMFEKFYNTNRRIQIKDVPSLEPLINKIFIEKNLAISEL